MSQGAVKHRVAAEMVALRRYALVLTRDRARAEDLVQETLSRALSSLDSFRPDADLRIWLFRILRNLHVDEHRRSLSEARLRRQVSVIAGGHARAAEVGVELRDVIAALDALPEAQSEALQLIALRELSYQEAAQVLDIPLGTLMSRLARGRQALRRLTEPEAAGVVYLVDASARRRRS